MSTELEDPTIEFIVGEENVVDVDAEQVEPETVGAQTGGFHCANCSFTSNLLSELEEHGAGTGHGRPPNTDPSKTQPYLPGLVHRSIEVPLDPEVLADKREKLAELYQESIDVKATKKSADSRFNSQLSDIDEQMQAIARVLATPVKFQQVDAEWHLIEGENARGLYRLDTGEMIEKQAISEEDYQAELEKAAAANKSQATFDNAATLLEQTGERVHEIPQDAEESAAEGLFINNRNKGRRKKRTPESTEEVPA